MELLQGEAFDALFRDFAREAFHLEVQDAYHTPEESGPFHQFLTGQADDFGWFQPWLDLVRTATAAGRVVRRARVVTVPHADYTRWGLTVAEHNIAAGEEIRWLPRHMIDPGRLSADDFWLFDDSLVVFTVFEPGGRFGGGAATSDSVIVDHCRAVRDRVWQAAIPHRQYRDTDHVTT
ncbi:MULTISPECIES: DUF6879 family protein [Actinoalloteichus]|uniref:DUF6879 domain-containing protein n=1 Tax=Actinoalloteichus fjordicus TaxID=1612552 RepID=A0AAC9LF81_9PSEU|nr:MULTISPECIES: DUF6879 family protein [Actinoalloteichus]APU16527.1 hypothetical protein UA74_22545 [Actinoalloteichus fjordicus]APU22595.1 hypothetical protein UA75_23065 [Actinoalloteichus sp. GBA129-24]